MVRNALVSLLLALGAVACAASAAAPAAPDPALEKRVMALSEQLRCLVCQNQTIADSNAELAVDLRQQVREKLGQGMSDEQVAAYLVQRYGDFVLYRPPLRGSTWLLWFGPLLLLAGGLLALALWLARPSRPDPRQPALAQDELALMNRLLDDQSGGR